MSDSLHGSRARVILPADLPSAEQDSLVAAGADFSEMVEDEPGLRSVVLPEGWTCESDDKLAPVYVLDGQGRYRARVDDRMGVPSVTFFHRYEVEVQHDDRRRVRAVVLDGNTIVFSTPRLDSGKPYSGVSEEARAIVRDQAEAWLDKHHSQWRKAVASWNT